MAITAWSEGHRVLYHWEKFSEERLSALLRDKRIYCSNPASFNDPWDCKPHFNTEILNDLAERQKHAQWAIDLCQRKSPMPPEAQERMRQTFLHNPAAAAKLINQLSGEMAGSIDEQYRVYCLGPDLNNLLMWAHYADSHRGICLEFSMRNKIFCAALKCEYSSTFPIMTLHDDSDDAALLSLLSKSDVWSYEKEYRLIVKEESKALPDSESLKSTGHFLEFPQGALVSVITGCQSDHQRIHDLVKSIDPKVDVKQATRVPNRFEISISQ
jgi:hypothetical protein